MHIIVAPADLSLTGRGKRQRFTTRNADSVYGDANVRTGKRTRQAADDGVNIPDGSIVDVTKHGYPTAKRGQVVKPDGVHAKQAKNTRAVKDFTDPTKKHVLVLYQEEAADSVYWEPCSACKIVD